MARPLPNLVLDTNYLKEPDLQKFLTMSPPESRVVLPSEVLWEAVKAPSADLARGEFRILSRFPDRVLVLKRMKHLLPLQPKRQSDLVDPTITASLQAALRNLDRTPDEWWARLSAEAARQRKARLEHHQASSPDLKAARDHMEARWSAHDQRVLTSKEGGTFSPDAINGLINDAFKFAAAIHADGQHGPPAASREEWLDRFAFRLSVCEIAWLLGRMEQGATSIGAKLAMTDSIDTTICACATYFGGFASLDFKRAHQTFAEAQAMLESALRGLRHITPEHMATFRPGELPP